MNRGPVWPTEGFPESASLWDAVSVLDTPTLIAELLDRLAPLLWLDGSVKGNLRPLPLNEKIYVPFKRTTFRFAYPL